MHCQNLVFRDILLWLVRCWLHFQLAEKNWMWRTRFFIIYIVKRSGFVLSVLCKCIFCTFQIRYTTTSVFQLHKNHSIRSWNSLNKKFPIKTKYSDHWNNHRSMSFLTKNFFNLQETIMDPQQQFCLKWNSYSSNLAMTFSNLFKSELLADVTLFCGGKLKNVFFFHFIFISLHFVCLNILSTTSV